MTGHRLDRRDLLKATGAGVLAVGASQHSLAGEVTQGTSAGDAETEETTEIEDWHDLDAVRENPDGEYVLVTDIDSTTNGYEEHVGDPEAGWDPIGDLDPDDAVEFTGTFDGNGHEIADLSIDRPDENNVGLFGINEGRIKDVTLTNAAVTGNNRVGVLVGHSYGGEIKVSSAEGAVTGTFHVGGLVGQNAGKIESAAAEADVTGDFLVGGLVGSSAGEVRSSHYNIDAVEINGEGMVTIGGLFDEQYQDWEESGRSLELGDYDSLTESDGRVEISDGQGVRDALGFIQNPSIDWRLTADIDLTEASPDLYLPYLAGGFDGNGHTITVDIDLPAASQVGAIGYNEEAGRITDLTVEGSVTGEPAVGGLVGWNFGKIESSAAEGDVTGGSQVGGLVGRNSGEVESSAAESDVTGVFQVGGLIGQNVGKVESSSAAGDITGNRWVGGLVGWNFFARIESSSSNGDVTGDSRVGGLVGQNSGDIELPSAVDSDVTGDVPVKGVVEDNGGEIASSFATGSVGIGVASSFATGSVDGNSEVGGVVGENEATVTDTYWDVETTGEQEGIGDGEGDTTGLETDEMQGETAAENMDGLDFKATWRVMTDSDDYPALITLESAPQPPELPGFDNPPTDINGDGLYEDINGDGKFDISDVQALFDDLDSDAVQNYPVAFNFAGANPDRVTIFDVQALFTRLQMWDE